MASAFRLVARCYRDSVTLMQFSLSLTKTPGVGEASAVMATAANLALLRESGVLADSQDPMSPKPDDLLVIVQGDGDLEAVLEEAETRLRSNKTARPGPGGSIEAEAPASVIQAVETDPELNFALISVPGEFAAAEALKALAQGLHVMLFSDNVSVEHEVFLKKQALERGLLLLGPDCGTAFLNGTPLGFANRLRKGPIGLVSASGTGLQEVACLIDRWGSGISQAFGTGGRDLKEAVGGISALACLEVLSQDPDTECLVLISKPPAPRVRLLLEEKLRALDRPAIFCVLGQEAPPSPVGSRLVFASTLEEAARLALMTIGKNAPSSTPVLADVQVQGDLRALYSGGTLCAEAAWLAGKHLKGVSSNVKVEGVSEMPDPWKSVGHSLVDLGEDEFTRGRPHPMIDPSLRNARLIQEAADPRTGALLVDVVLGFGAHADPAASLAETVQGLKPRKDRSAPPVFASVTGTEADSQVWSASIATLKKAGILTFESNREAVLAALGSLS